MLVFRLITDDVTPEPPVTTELHFNTPGDSCESPDRKGGKL